MYYVFYIMHDCKSYMYLKLFSDAVLSQQPSPKNYLQKFLSLIFNNLNQIHRDPKKKICKTFFGLGCCDKTASENDFRHYKITIITWPGQKIVNI